MIEMSEKLEKIFAERALVQAVATKLERMPLGELLYHAVVECGKECRLLNGGAMQGA